MESKTFEVIDLDENVEVDAEVKEEPKKEKATVEVVKEHAPKTKESWRKGYVTCPILNVRSTPNGIILGQLYEKNPVDILDSSNGEWHKILWHNEEAYVMKNYISCN